MNNIIMNTLFEKVSYEQFKKDFKNTTDERLYPSLKEMYNSILLPRRATKGSAGYDFYSPHYIRLDPGQDITIPTGIRCKMNPELVLIVCPRSGLGFKYYERLANTIGIIDSDYYYSDNEGHIMIKIRNDSTDSVMEIEQGKGLAQGIFLPYFKTDDDSTKDKRNGGFGSTGK